MLLGKVFVPQTARADPPPVELPRELWRRLAEAGEIRDQDLPAGLDKNLLDKMRASYQNRPAKPVLDVIAGPDGQHLVLLGDPGAGKSTLARYLMLALAETAASGNTATPQTGDPALSGIAGWLPLLVELRTYADPRWRDRTFLDLIDHLHTTEHLGLPHPLLEDFLRQNGRAVMVFDGLDEVFDPAIREQIARQIEAFAARYPQVRVIVTSRVIGYRRAIFDAAGFTHWMLQDLTLEQITTFTRAWYRASCAGNPADADRLRERLLGAVRNSPAVAELAGNPMLLTILAIIGRRQELPRERLAVYEHAVSVLVEHWDTTGKHLHYTRAGGMPYLAHQDKLELLRLVARRMQDAPAGFAGNHVPGPDLITEFDTYLRDRFELRPAGRFPPHGPCWTSCGNATSSSPSSAPKYTDLCQGLPRIFGSRRHMPAVFQPGNDRRRTSANIPGSLGRPGMAGSPRPDRRHDHRAVHRTGNKRAADHRTPQDPSDTRNPKWRRSPCCWH